MLQCVLLCMLPKECICNALFAVPVDVHVNAYIFNCGANNSMHLELQPAVWAGKSASDSVISYVFIKLCGLQKSTLVLEKMICRLGCAIVPLDSKQLFVRQGAHLYKRLRWVGSKFQVFQVYMVVPGHENRNDAASEFLSTHWWSQHPAYQRCLGRAASRWALAPEPPPPHESDQRSSDFDFSGRWFLNLVFSPLFFSLFFEIGLHYPISDQGGIGA